VRAQAPWPIRATDGAAAKLLCGRMLAPPLSPARGAAHQLPRARFTKRRVCTFSWGFPYFCHKRRTVQGSFCQLRRQASARRCNRAGRAPRRRARAARRQTRIVDQVIIGTHGKLKNWLSKRVLSVKAIRILVFDEADEMLKARAAPRRAALPAARTRAAGPLVAWALCAPAAWSAQVSGRPHALHAARHRRLRALAGHNCGTPRRPGSQVMHAQQSHRHRCPCCQRDDCAALRACRRGRPQRGRAARPVGGRVCLGLGAHDQGGAPGDGPAGRADPAFLRHLQRPGQELCAQGRAGRQPGAPAAPPRRATGPASFASPGLPRSARACARVCA